MITDAMRLNFIMYDEGDADVRNREVRIVTTRKPVACVKCRKTIEIGERTYTETAFVDSRPCKAKTCLSCIDAAIIESGEIDDLSRDHLVYNDRELLDEILRRANLVENQGNDFALWVRTKISERGSTGNGQVHT